VSRPPATCCLLRSDSDFNASGMSAFLAGRMERRYEVRKHVSRRGLRGCFSERQKLTLVAVGLTESHGVLLIWRCLVVWAALVAYMAVMLCESWKGKGKDGAKLGSALMYLS
jgi:hypothetical protein